MTGSSVTWSPADGLTETAAIVLGVKKQQQVVFLGANCNAVRVLLLRVIQGL